MLLGLGRDEDEFLDRGAAERDEVVMLGRGVAVRVEGVFMLLSRGVI